jgi:hypothetical protein
MTVLVYTRMRKMKFFLKGDHWLVLIVFAIFVGHQCGVFIYMFETRSLMLHCLDIIRILDPGPCAILHL